MFLAGDEFGNTQYGNNNAYCQDNEVSWLDWGRLKQYRGLHDFTASMIAFRKKHPVLRGNTGAASCGWRRFLFIMVLPGIPGCMMMPVRSGSCLPDRTTRVRMTA